MLIRLSRHTLAQAFHKLEPAIAIRPYRPILACVHFEASQGRITVTSSSGSLMLQVDLPSGHDDTEVIRSGAVALPAKILAEIIRRLPDRPVEIERLDDASTSLRCDRTGYRLSSLPPNEFTRGVFTLPGLIRIDNAAFKAAVRQVAFAASTSQARPVLTGVLVQAETDRLRLTASDGMRLASVSLTGVHPRLEIPASVVVPAGHLADVARLLSDTGTADMGICESSFVLRTTNYRMHAHILAGSFPGVDSLSSTRFNAAGTTDAMVLLQSVERVALLSGKSRVVTMNFHSPEANIYARDGEMGQVDASIEIRDACGPSISISFNADYMAGILKAIGAGEVGLRFAGHDRPILLQPLGNPNAWYLLTPVLSHRTRPVV